MTFRIAGPAMPAAAGAALIVVVAAVVAVIVIPRLAAGLHFVIAPVALLVARRTLAPALFPTAARCFGMAFRIAVPAAVAVPRIVPASTRGLGMTLGIAIPAAVPVVAAFPAAPGGFGMTFRVAEPAAGRVPRRIRRGGCNAPSSSRSRPIERSPVALIPIVITAAGPRTAFTHEAPILIPVRTITESQRRSRSSSSCRLRE